MQKLFNDLNIQAIVIIEDETTAYNFNQYLSWLLSSRHLLNSLVEVDKLVELSNAFVSQLESYSKQDEIKKQIMFDTPYIDFIDHIDDISLQDTLQSLQKYYTEINSEVLFWNQLAKPDTNYDNILQIVEETKLPIHYMNNFDYSAEGIQKLTHRLGRYNSESRVFYIVDKFFSGQEKGYDIINYLLTKLSGLPLPVSVIFTSNIGNQQSSLKDRYFKYEISKDTLKDALAKLITDVSRSCEYVHAISTLSNENKLSLAKAEEEILKSESLFSKIIQTAHDEGVSPYEVMNEWLVLSQHYYFSNSMADKLGSLFSSSKVFLGHTPSLYSDTNINQMHLINSFEIFDTYINKKYLPVAPGDIFQLNDKYYVLVGQACDTSCRSNMIRKTNVAELLEASITTKKYSDKAQMISDNAGTSVIFRHFPIGDETKQLKIDVNKLRTCPFDLLDLAAYNDNGDCKIDTKKPLSKTAENILPEGQREKYGLLQASLKNLFSKHLILETISNDIFGHFAFHFFSSQVKFTNSGKDDQDNFIIDTKFKRIARLKGNFNYFLNKARHDYIGRVDLNGIHFNSEHVTFTVKCKFNGEQESKINAWYDRAKRGWILKKDELIEKFSIIPHFQRITDDYLLIKEHGKKDSKSKIDYQLENDTIILDCPIEVTYSSKKDYLYNGETKYKLSVIIKSFPKIKCGFGPMGSSISFCFRAPVLHRIPY